MFISYLYFLLLIMKFSWHILLRMRAPKEGPCEPIAPLELPHSLHAFHRVSSSDELNKVRESSLFPLVCVTCFIIFRKCISSVFKSGIKMILWQTLYIQLNTSYCIVVFFFLSYARGSELNVGKNINKQHFSANEFTYMQHYYALVE